MADASNHSPLHEASIFAENWLNPGPQSGRSHNEKAHAQSYWREFFSSVMNIRDLYDYGVRFEYRIKNVKTGTPNWIDVFIPGVVLIEHKSAGKDLNEAEVQARGYVESLKKELRPDWIILCDFVDWRIINYVTGETQKFRVDALPSKLGIVEQILAQSSADISLVQMEWDKKAADLISDVHREMIKSNYDKHSANILITRLLFLMFADDLQILSREPIFDRLIAESKEDGSDLGGLLYTLFHVVNQPHTARSSNIPPLIAKFPHIGGELFAEQLPPVFFNTDLRNAILAATGYEWSSVNPIVMGSLYQQIKTAEERHSGGEHFTSEKNAYRALRGLMLDELYERKEQSWNDTAKLEKLRKHLGEIKLADFACGSGNLLAVGYRELRNMEIDIIARMKQLRGTYGDIGLFNDTEIYVTLDQVYGVEIEEYSALLAQVSLFLVDALMNKELEMITGIVPTTFPLEHKANIICANALQVDWKAVCPPDDNVRLVMNPPFLGANKESSEQKADQNRIWGKVKAGSMDFVSNWFLLAGQYMQGTKAKSSIVSSNSISQGENVYILWNELYKMGMGIDFAYRSFKWGNGGAGKVAAVHVVIVGISANKADELKSLYYFPNNDDNAAEKLVPNINGYLLAAEEVLIPNRTNPICDVPKMIFGSMPNDEGYLSKISKEEKEAICMSDPIAAKYIKRLIGSDEMISNIERYCLWLDNAEPSDIRNSPFIKERVAKVKQIRLKSTRPATQKLADVPHLFGERRQSKSSYIGVPSISAHTRDYIPIGFFEPDVIASNKVFLVPEAKQDFFALLTSKIFNIWNDAIGGRMGVSYQLSNTLVYNNFPFPELTSEQKTSLEASGRSILDARAKYPTSTLADLYDPLAMPVELREAHKKNDKLVLALYGLKPENTYDEIINELFKRYKELTSTDVNSPSE
jgi:hypothetical protein